MISAFQGNHPKINSEIPLYNSVYVSDLYFHFNGRVADFKENFFPKFYLS
jgi:hypothetical protein